MTKLDSKFYGTIRKVKNDERVPEDQWMVFLVKDTAFANILPRYREECARLGAGREQLAAVDRAIKRVETWRTENRSLCKVPDAAGEPLLDDTSTWPLPDGALASIHQEGGAGGSI